MRKTTASRRPTQAAALWLLLLGPFFFLVYGACNWLTSLRTDVGSFYFDWERYIPFVPVMILPYMSTDLLFAGSFFLCRDKEELRTLAQRFSVAIVVSAVGFLLFPLRFAFPRPYVDGLLGAMFNLLTSFDKPYNQAPSLHISLLVIQWMVYAKHTKGVLKRVLHLWCVLIGLSTVLTFQHHIIDLYLGVIVAIVCYYLFPDPQGSNETSTGVRTLTSVPERQHYPVIGVYLAGALILASVAWANWQAMHLLLWPAAALAIVGAAYAGLGTAVFLKFGGELSLCSRLALAPYFIGAYLSFRLYAYKQQAYHEVIPGLIISRKLTDDEAKQAISRGVTAVVDLTAEFAEAKSFRALPCFNMQILDLTPPSVQQLRQTVEFISAHHPTGTVLVHCTLGYSRSACVIAAHLMASGHACSVSDAIEKIRKVRPSIVLKARSLAILEAYSRSCLAQNYEEIHASTI